MTIPMTNSLSDTLPSVTNFIRSFSILYLLQVLSNEKYCLEAQSRAQDVVPLANDEASRGGSYNELIQSTYTQLGSREAHRWNFQFRIMPILMCCWALTIAVNLTLQQAFPL